MKDLYEHLLKIRAEQEAEAGPFFAELSTPETWLELMRWILRKEDADFPAQMAEVAAMAMWALEASQASTELSATLDEAFQQEPQQHPTSSAAVGRFGPVDRPLRLSGSSQDS
ncbi:MAG TPA: hypothetical protein VF614_04205 [Chthoniobacteraceae bacterium]|jgi:hypothetical protein